MKTVSMLEFRNNAEDVIRQIRQGQHMILTYRGKPVARFVPIRDDPVKDDDPFYSLGEMADSKGKPLSNKQIVG